MNRTKAREYAFIILFEYKFQPESISEILSDFFEMYDAGAQKDYINTVVSKTVDNIEDIDAKIQEASDTWKLETMSIVSITALRLAVCEILYMEDIPPMVALNEAITIAKKYHGEEAAPFVNAILDRIKKSVEA